MNTKLVIVLSCKSGNFAHKHALTRCTTYCEDGVFYGPWSHVCPLEVLSAKDRMDHILNPPKRPKAKRGISLIRKVAR